MGQTHRADVAINLPEIQIEISRTTAVRCIDEQLTVTRSSGRVAQPGVVSDLSVLCGDLRLDKRARDRRRRQKRCQRYKSRDRKKWMLSRPGEKPHCEVLRTEGIGNVRCALEPPFGIIVQTAPNRALPACVERSTRW